MKQDSTPNDDTILQKITVFFEYPVSFTHGLFENSNSLLENFFHRYTSRRTKVLVYIDSGVKSAWPTLSNDITRYLVSRPEMFELVTPPEVITGGESAKNGWSEVQKVMTQAASMQMCRHSYIIAIGGGSMLDITGFAASLVHRGIRLLRVPTTVLSQCDGGVGVKTGMDEHGMKNFAGTFAPPAGVLNDFDFLATLPDTYWYGGIAEALKVAIIKDKAFFKELMVLSKRLSVRDHTAIEPVIIKAAKLHLDHIREGGDPFEFGTARPLDFGHWAAHKLEVLSGYSIGHGQAVAIGIAIDSCYAAKKGFITEAERNLILSTMHEIGLTLWTPLLSRQCATGERAILAGLDEFQQHLGGELTVTLPRGIGNTIEVHTMDSFTILKSIDFLEQSFA